MTHFRVWFVPALDGNFRPKVTFASAAGMMPTPGFVQ